MVSIDTLVKEWQALARRPHSPGRRSLSLSVFFDVFHRFWTGDEAVVDAVSPETMQSARD